MMLPADQVARRSTAKVLAPGLPGAARPGLDPVFPHPSRPGSGMDPRNPACLRLVVATGFEHLFDVFHRAQADDLISNGRNVGPGACYGRFVGRLVRNPGTVNRLFDLRPRLEPQVAMSSNSRGERMPSNGWVKFAASAVPAAAHFWHLPSWA